MNMVLREKYSLAISLSSKVYFARGSIFARIESTALKSWKEKILLTKKIDLKRLT